MNRLDRYLLKRMLAATVMILMTAVLAVILLDVIFKLNSLLPFGNGRWLLILKLYLLRIPSLVSPLLPLAVVGGALITVAPLLRRGEIIATTAAGISPQAACRALFIFALAAGALDLVISDQIAPRCEGPLATTEDRLTGETRRGSVWAVPETGSAWLAGYARIGDHSKPEITAISVGTADGDLITAQALEWRDNQWVLCAPVITVPRNDPAARQVDGDTACAGALALPYQPQQLANLIASRHALTSIELFERGGRQNTAVIASRWLRLLAPLLCLCCALAWFLRYNNRTRLLVAALESFGIASVPLVLLGLGSAAASNSSIPVSVAALLAAAVAAAPAAWAVFRWRL